MEDIVLISLKTILFLFILSSPFYNVQDVFYFLDVFPAKIILLVIIIIASFIDLQLAILASIAFFILLLTFANNNITRSRVFTNDSDNKYITKMPLTIPMVTSDSEFLKKKLIENNLPPKIENKNPNFMKYIEPTTLPTSQSFQCKIKEDIIQDIENLQKPTMQTMYSFPDVDCKTPKEANNDYMNRAQVDYTLDQKIKPYEEFISQMTNLETLDNVCNAAYYV